MKKVFFFSIVFILLFTLVFSSFEDTQMKLTPHDNTSYFSSMKSIPSNIPEQTVRVTLVDSNGNKTVTYHKLVHK